uniref:Uncharacterized protein n=1 Tax=Heterorhabditis bacteriophora TaxID=37862 RepID=A0A1I7W8U7_HETBA
MFNQLSPHSQTAFLDGNCCGAFDRKSLARRRRKKWRRLSALEWNRSCAANSTSYDLHPKAITRLVELNDYSFSGIWDVIEVPGLLIENRSKISYQIRIRR